MRKILIIFLILLLSGLTSAGWFQDEEEALQAVVSGVQGGETPNQEIGFTTLTGGSTASTPGRGMEIVVPEGGITVSYGYVYGTSSLTPNVSLGVYETDGTLIETCSGTVQIQNVAAQWWEVTWASPFFLPAGTYRLQSHTDNNYSYYRVEIGSNNVSVAAPTACDNYYSTASTYKTTMSIANYNVR